MGEVQLKAGHVCLATCHQAKGLEWDVVILTDVNDRQVGVGVGRVEGKMQG